MSPEQYCYKKAFVPGSAFYYSAKKLNSIDRDAVIAIQAFYQELEEVLFHFTDVGIAQARYNWWREEIIKVYHGRPDHPVSLFLLKNKIDTEKLMEMIDGFEQTLSFARFASFEDVVVHFMRTAGVRELLFATVIKAKQPVDVEMVYQGMLVLELTHYLQHLHHYVRSDLIYFGEDEMNRFHVQRIDFNLGKTTDAIRALLSYQAEKVERAQALLVNSAWIENSFVRVRIKIAVATLKELADSQFCVLESFIDLTVLRRWWLAR
jgi:phytoene synthase